MMIRTKKIAENEEQGKTILKALGWQSKTEMVHSTVQIVLNYRIDPSEVKNIDTAKICGRLGLCSYSFIQLPLSLGGLTWFTMWSSTWHHEKKNHHNEFLMNSGSETLRIHLCDRLRWLASKKNVTVWKQNSMMLTNFEIDSQPTLKCSKFGRVLLASLEISKTKSQKFLLLFTKNSWKCLLLHD